MNPFALLLAVSALSQEPVRIVPREWLVLSSVDRSGRRPFRPDAAFEKYLLDREAAPPEEGQELSGETDEPRAWEKRVADENGQIEGRRFAWAYTSIESDADRVLLARVRGAATFFVNGTGYTGDYYGYGFGGLPVHLLEGNNDVYVTSTRRGQRVVVELTEPAGRLVAARWDTTKPDLVVGEPPLAEVAVLVLNASTEPVEALEARVVADGPFRAGLASPPPGLVPLAVAKVPLSFAPASKDTTMKEAGSVSLGFVVEDPRLGDSAAGELTLDVRERGETRRITFRSSIDDSIQEYAVVSPTDEEGAKGLVLSCHGAGVGCLGQARAYSRKPDLWIVAATNRRPFGFDWQDWGRLDAYEVIEHALAWTGADRSRLYVTGHSMGGHGTWHLGANDPDGFAAIAPSAGWASFDSYGGRPDGSLEALWQAADGASRTLDLVDNLVQLPTFVLHGENDDNVPAKEAHDMIAALEAAGGKPQSHFQPGAGHWWNGDAAPGADCVDWPGIFDLFRASVRAAAPAEIRFTTVDPSVDADHYWVRVEQPLVYGERSKVRGSWNAERREVRIETDNVRRLTVRAIGGAVPRRVSIDGDGVQGRGGEEDLHLLRRDDGSWIVEQASLAARAPEEKRPDRSGPFKRAFDRGFVLVYGTAGSANETRELLERARFDASTWWYRANGLARILSDVELLREDGNDRNVILYGNADTNRAWTVLLGKDCPIVVERGKLVLGEKTFEGEDLGCVFVYRRADSRNALVGAFGDTGIAGSRLGYTLAPFISGVGYPDYAVFDADVLRKGDGGVLAAGWFDARWQPQK